MALVIRLLLGWPIPISIVLAAAIVLVYITLGGLSSAIYNEVLQFFVILAALVPLTIVGLKAVGGWSGLQDKVTAAKALGPLALQPWEGPGPATSPTRSGPTGSRSCSGSALCCRSATGPPTSPRSSGPWRPRTSLRPGAPH
jgi:Na+/proline symporter